VLIPRERGYNADNELTGHDDVGYEYDENGNMVKRTVGGQVTSFVYNIEDRLTEVWNGEAGTGSLTASYYCDPFGRRLWKEVQGTRRYFHYADEGLVGEYDSTGAEIKTYGYKPGSTWTTAPLFVKQNGQYYFYHNDHLGTPQKITAVNGAVVWSAKYESFGKANVEIETVENNLRFPGQYYDGETGLHYNFNRYYDAEVGRYLRRDPIGFKGGMNLFVFVLNNPINNIDPLGLFIDEVFPGPGPGDDPYQPVYDPLTGQIYYEYAPKEPILSPIEVIADGASGCIYCLVKCSVENILPSAAQSYFVKNVLLEGAKGLVKASLKKAIPIYNVVDIAVTTAFTGKCVIDCARKQ